MVKILNIGSINIDFVYKVSQFPEVGETLPVDAPLKFPGGKGLNQSVAMAYAGVEIYHAGKTGPDGEWLVHTLTEAGVHTEYIDTGGSMTGHAIIQVDPDGHNIILVCSGANFELERQYVDTIINKFSAGDILVLQNEVNEIEYIMQKARQRGMKIYFNPSPITTAIIDLPLKYVDTFILNEIEGQTLTGKREFEDIAVEMTKLYPDAAIVLTLGKHGVLYRHGDFVLSHGVYDVPVVDTTAAGDTFAGYFISSVAVGKDVGEALRLASLASSIAVSRQGASVSIPTLTETTECVLTPL